MNNTQVELCQVLFTGTGEMQLIKSCMNNGVVKLDPPQPAFSFGWNLPQHGSQCSCVQVTLKQEYLLNTIELEGTNSQPLKNNNIMCIPPITDDEVPMLNTSSQNFRAVSDHLSWYTSICKLYQNALSNRIPSSIPVCMMWTKIWYPCFSLPQLLTTPDHVQTRFIISY